MQEYNSQTNMREARVKIKKLIAEAKETQQWGGSEDSEGVLQRGEVDLEELEYRVLAVLNGLEEDYD